MILTPFLHGERKDAPHEGIFLRKFDQGIRAVRGGDYKLVEFEKTSIRSLHNLKHDIREATNIKVSRTSRHLSPAMSMRRYSGSPPKKGPTGQKKKAKGKRFHGLCLFLRIAASSSVVESGHMHLNDQVGTARLFTSPWSSIANTAKSSVTHLVPANPR